MNKQISKKEFKEYLKFFKNYVKTFHERGSRKSKKKLKTKHTFRVIKIITKIARQKKQDIYLSKTIALFHDLGRFYQAHKYNSFNDLKTFDHGEFGVKILEKNQVLSQLNPKTRDIVLTTVFYHNKHPAKIPKLPKEKDIFVKLIRDADKIDILRITAKTLKKNSIEKTASKKVIRQALKNKIVSIEYVKKRIDTVLLNLDFIYDINFTPSFKIVKKQKYYRKLLTLLPDTPEFNKIKMRVIKHIDDKSK